MLKTKKRIEPPKGFCLVCNVPAYRTSNRKIGDYPYRCENPHCEVDRFYFDSRGVISEKDWVCKR